MLFIGKVGDVRIVLFIEKGSQVKPRHTVLASTASLHFLT